VRLVNTIRKKIWLCVNVALLGFIVATGFALYSNQQLRIHLTHIRDLDFSLAIQSNELLNLFVVQSELYKESFLFGSFESANQGNLLREQIKEKIDSITKMKRSVQFLPSDKIESLMSLEKKYYEYVEQAVEIYPLLARGNDPGDHVEALHHLAVSQNEIRETLEYFSGLYRQHFSSNVTALMDITTRNSRFLAVFFVGLLGTMVLVVNWVAKLTLINPLTHIKEAVRSFGRGNRSFPALEVMDAKDEIGELGEAIITMTGDLVKTTVSKAYVDSILHNMNDSLIVTSRDFLIRYVNRATLDLLGYKHDELIGRHISTILSEFLCGVKDCGGGSDDENLFSRLCSNAEKIFLTRAGQEIPVLLSTSRLKDGDSDAQGLVFVAKDITDRKKVEQKLEQMALYDFLTGLPNRMTFNDRLEQTLKQAHREGHQAGLMFLDLDRFKEINDTMGHDSGDALLKNVAGWLRDCVRESDTVARLGGDEFAVILDNINEPYHAVNTAATPENLLKNADMAMYEAKQKGGNGYSFFSRK